MITGLYFDNIVRYIRAGGAVLVAAGPDYESPTSLWRTPLGTMLPAEPTGRTTEMPFRARLSELGVLSTQCLDRRIPDKQTLIDEIAAWQTDRNTHHTKSDWHFTTKDARVKLKHLYPSI